MTKSEKLAIEILEKEGCLVDYARRTPYGHFDIFGLWDILAVDSDYIRFIQIGAHYVSQRPDEWKEKLKNFKKHLPKTKCIFLEYWRYKKDGTFEIDEL